MCPYSSGDSITEAMRGTQFGEHYDELSARRNVFEQWFPLHEARAFGISGDRTQNLLYRIGNGELGFRHPPGVVVLCVGTNNLGGVTTVDGDGDGDRDRDRDLGRGVTCFYSYFYFPFPLLLLVFSFSAFFTSSSSFTPR